MPVSAVVGERSRNLETPRAGLLSDGTPNETFFVRDHFDEPDLDPVTYRLLVNDGVGGDLSLSLMELGRFPQHRVTCVLECAGNGRRSMVPRPQGIPWGEGAVGCATWEGPALRDVLNLAPPNEDTVDVVFCGADVGVESDAVRAFERSLPVDVAIGDGPILALRMNGAPLPRGHGAPVRLIVPGWYGVASVKWLTEIRYVTQPFAGYFQRERYVWDNGRPVRGLRPRAVLLRPDPQGPVSAGPHRLEGRAWAGAGLAGVDVRVDGGPWIPAHLEIRDEKWAWVHWSCDVVLEEGTHWVCVRARDTSGQQQPLEPVVNRFGYGYNTADEIRVTVRRRRPRIATFGAAVRDRAHAFAPSDSSLQPGPRRSGYARTPMRSARPR